MTTLSEIFATNKLTPEQAKRRRRLMVLAMVSGVTANASDEGVPSGGDGTMDFSDPDASALIALLEDI